MSLPHPILAIDYGDARIGLAMTDPVGILPHPVETVQNTVATFSRISEIITHHKVQSILIGLPLRLDGSEGTSVIKIRKFKNALMKHLEESQEEPLPVAFMDERHSTVEAAKKLHQVGKNAKKQKSLIDQAAAVVILGRYLEQEANPFGLLEDPDTPNFQP